MWSRSLREVHEYQADRAALDRGFDSRQYIILMLRQSTDLHPELVSGFGHSLIKKRLVMISRFSPRRAKFRILLSLPLVALLMALVSFTAVPASGADRPSGSGAADSVRSVAGPGSERSDRVYERPEVMPEFPGDAPNALMSWIAGHLKYPAEAAEKGISGTVVCRFVVSKTGRVLQPEIIESPDRSLSEEVLRLFGLMPNWKPGSQDGVPVDVSLTLPVRFSL